MKKAEHRILKVLPGSIAEELELEKNDVLEKINDQDIGDIFDYYYLTQDEYLVLLVKKANGEIWELEIEKDTDEDLGIVFENGLMDEYKSCRNKCVFCFIDQMPSGMRETLYFKDDDSRLSFMQGNYVTLTNVSEEDLDRIIAYRLTPINISFHTMNPKLRCEMLHNRFAGEIAAKVQRLYDADLTMNGQIVLCKGINDGEELKYSLEQLMQWAPNLQSVSVVPVGLTRYRDGLPKLESFEQADAVEVLSIIEDIQKKCMEQYGIHFVHASDEWYLLAGRSLPEEERYDNYIQLENGVGMLRLLIEEVREALDEKAGDDRVRKVSIATGKLAYPFICELAGQIMEKYPNLEISVYLIENHFWGEKITVTGLITGKDLLAQLKDKDLGDELLLSVHMFRSEEEVLLDDLTKTDLETELKVPVSIVKSRGSDFVEAILGEEHF